jgi:hypothetical protein
VIDRTNGELDPADRNRERPALAKALAAARVRQVPIVVAKVDRLTRSVGFLSMLLDAGADVRFADLPQIEGTAGRFMLKQMALVAELEAGFISDRTKAALDAAKRRGKKLGGFRAGAKLSAKARQKGANANAEAAAAARAADLASLLIELQASGDRKARSMTEASPTARGSKWFAASVRDVLARTFKLRKPTASHISIGSSGWLRDPGIPVPKGGLPPESHPHRGPATSSSSSSLLDQRAHISCGLTRVGCRVLETAAAQSFLRDHPTAASASGCTTRSGKTRCH